MNVFLHKILRDFYNVQFKKLAQSFKTIFLKMILNHLNLKMGGGGALQNYTNFYR